MLFEILKFVFGTAKEDIAYGGKKKQWVKTHIKSKARPKLNANHPSCNSNPNTELSVFDCHCDWVQQTLGP